MERLGSGREDGKNQSCPRCAGGEKVLRIISNAGSIFEKEVNRSLPLG